MGLATIMIHIIMTCRTSSTKSPSLVLIRLVLKIQPFENVKINKEMCGFPDTVSDTVSGWPYISLLILTVLKRSISVKTNLINTKLGDFESRCALSVDFANPIIYRLTSSPSRFEIRQ